MISMSKKKIYEILKKNLTSNKILLKIKERKKN